jgi:hypothetical protein
MGFILWMELYKRQLVLVVEVEEILDHRVKLVRRVRLVRMVQLAKMVKLVRLVRPVRPVILAQLVLREQPVLLV